MNHGTGPVQLIEQGFEVTDPQGPLVLDGAVTRAEVDHLGLVRPFVLALAIREHLAADEWPALPLRQGVQRRQIDSAALPRLLGFCRRPVADTAVNDGFRLQMSTPDKSRLLRRDHRVCCRFAASRVAAPNVARQGAGRRQWSLPCQVPQRRMATFAAQPFGPGLFLRDTAFLVVYLEPPNFTPRALPRAKNRRRRGRVRNGNRPYQPAAKRSSLHAARGDP